MVVVGSDSHKRTHTFVAVDGNGRELAHNTVAATPAGHLEGLRWAEQWPDRTWALEDCRHLSRRLEADLLWAGERVLRVPPRLMAGARRGGRQPGKSDPIDALAVARAARREPDLPVASLEGIERDVRLLVDHREDLVCERTRAQNRLLWHLHELRPGLQLPAGALSTLKTLDRVLAEIEGQHNGSAPIPVWSGNEDRHRLNRDGNRQLNAALHRIAITQMQRSGPARDYIDKRMASSDTKTEAIRSLRRKISDEVYRRMRADEAARPGSTEPVAEAA